MSGRPIGSVYDMDDTDDIIEAYAGEDYTEIGSLDPSVQDSVSPEEWAMRVDLAGTFRLLAHYGWDDLVFTQVSGRIPGDPDHFLINPFGTLFEEITASGLVKVDRNGEAVDPEAPQVNASGFALHAAIHEERPDLGCVIHLHTEDGVAVSAQADGLRPLSQHAMALHGRIAYHDYNGIAMDLDDRMRLVYTLGDRPAMILRNHGTLAVGETCADALMVAYYLEKACSVQVRAMAGGQDLSIPDEDAARATARQGKSLFSGPAGDLVWPALMRKLERIDPSFMD